MDLQNYLLCILYTILILAHSFTLAQKDFHRTLISIFSLALLSQTFSTVLFTIHQALVAHNDRLTNSYVETEPDLLYYTHYLAQWIHITSINFFILFLLIIAKGWPITRGEMPFKYAFATFWILCFAADLITFYWSTSSILHKKFSRNDIDKTVNGTTSNLTAIANSTTLQVETTTLSNVISTPKSILALDSLPTDTEDEFNSIPRRLSLLIRIIIMLYFLLELRSTMLLEQEQKKLQFYLHFGAFSMVWYVHSLVVYVISQRVEALWQTKLISGFSSAADFLAFAVSTRLLWPHSSSSLLFRKQKLNSMLDNSYFDGLDPLSTLNSRDSEKDEEPYDGLEMTVLKISSNNGT